MIDAALTLARQPGYERLPGWTHMHGFRGHFATHSRRYSTTLTALRQARVDHRSRPQTGSDAPPWHHGTGSGGDADDQIAIPAELGGHHRDVRDRPSDEDTTLVVNEWRFEGVGYTTDGDAALAASAEAAAREWRRLVKEVINDWNQSKGAAPK